MARQTLTAADGESGRTWDQSWALYKVKDGVLSNAATLPPDNAVGASGSRSAGIDLTGNIVGSVSTSNLSATLGNGHVVSRDGNRALFIDTGNRETVNQLYLHRDGQPSLLLTKAPSAPNVPSSAGPTGAVPIGIFDSWTGSATANLAGAALLATGDRDLSVILFSSRDKLVAGAQDDGSVNTYRYDVAGNSLEYLPDLQRPGSATSYNQAGNVYRMSDDASRILFRTPTGEIRLWRLGLSTLTLATGVPLPNATANGITAARFADDNRTVIFMSRTPIAGASGAATHPTGGQPNRTQVYRYNEDYASVPTCISCPVAGVTAGPAVFDLLTPMNSGFGHSGIRNESITQSRAVSADGRRVYFTTTTVLDPDDRNAVTDVYEWSVDHGAPMLISSGDPDSRGDALVDISATGDNVFFVSESRLTASDTDELYDLYTARVGGGLPDPPAFDSEAGCDVGSCQAEGPDTTARLGLGSASLAGNGNLSFRSTPGRPKVRVARAGAVAGPVARLRVRVPGRGRILVNGPAVKRFQRSLPKAGSYLVAIRLTPKSRKALRNRKALGVKVRIAYRVDDGRSVVKVVKVSFRQPKAKRSPKSIRKAVR